ncbi:glycosyltransferase [Chitinivorax sp. B]|uniref:glycosyltransferase n=1 Tax=Chitinivorax sp. B TaxID=2502235 RepID=UPI0010F4712A|nr:glycosyltransferase [Chitinivorax sp. B]
MSASPLKVLYVIGSLNIGGAENQLLMLSSELIKRGREAHLFSLEDDGPLKALLMAAGVQIHTGGYNSQASRWKKVFSLLRAEWRLFWLTLTLRPHALHAFLPLTNFMGALTGRLLGVKTVITSRRALGTHQDRHPWWKWCDRIANICSTSITANSQAVVDDTISRDKVNPGKIRLIYNGLHFSGNNVECPKRNEIRNNLGIVDDQIALVSVANLIPYKGHQDLIEAFSIIYKTNPNVHLYLIGEDRGILCELKKFAHMHSVDKAITYMGRRNDVNILLCAMDIGIMASHEEGCSNALLEKLAAGLPIVATSVGGNVEVLYGMPGCELVLPKNPIELANGIRKILGEECLPSISSRKRTELVISRFSVAEMVNSHENLYQSPRHENS